MHGTLTLKRMEYQPKWEDHGYSKYRQFSILAYGEGSKSCIRSETVWEGGNATRRLSARKGNFTTQRLAYLLVTELVSLFVENRARPDKFMVFTFIASKLTST